MAIFSLLPIFGYAFFIHFKYKITISSSLFFSITFILSTLSILGMINLLQFGGYALFYGGFALLVYMILQNKKEALEFSKSLPSLLFIVFSGVYLYLFYQAEYFFWDEFSHWGVYIKEMMFTHQLYGADTISAHPNYPPGPAVWQYFISLNTIYSEGSTYFAHFLLLIGSTIVLYERVSFKQIHWILLIFSIQILLFANFGHGFNSIYVDHVVGALFAGLILSFLSNNFNTKNLFLLFFPLTALILTRSIGLYFALSFVTFALIMFIVNSMQKDSSFINSIKENRNLILIILSVFILNLAVHFGWGLRQTIQNVPKEVRTITGVVSKLLSSEEVLDTKTQDTVKKRFWEVFNNQQIHKSQVSQNYNEFSYNTMSAYKSKLKFTTRDIFIFYIIISLIAFFVYKNYHTRVKIAIISSYFLLVSIIYVFILYFSYQVVFGNDALRIPSYVRYMNIAILPLMFLSLSLFLALFKNQDIEMNTLKNKKRQQIKDKDSMKIFFTLLGIVIVFYIVTKPYIKTLYTTPPKNSFVASAKPAIEDVLKKVPQNSKILVIFPIRNNGLLNTILRYMLIPTKATVTSHNFFNNPENKILEEYKKYDYIWFTVMNNFVVQKNMKILKLNQNKQVIPLYKVENNQFIPVIK